MFINLEKIYQDLRECSRLFKTCSRIQKMFAISEIVHEYKNNSRFRKCHNLRECSRFCKRNVHDLSECSQICKGSSWILKIFTISKIVREFKKKQWFQKVFTI